MARGTDAELKHIAQVIVLNMVCHILEYKLTIKKLSHISLPKLT